MADIPLVRARYAYGFAQALNKFGAPTNRLLEAHRLSPEILFNQDGWITAHQLWNFASAAVLHEGIPELGFYAGQVPVVDHGNFGKMVYHAITLYDAITIFCDNARIEYSRSDFYLRQDDHYAWFCRGPIDGEDMARQQVELYVLSLMIDTIRLYTGKDWQPLFLYLQNNDQKGLADLPLLKQSNTHFGCKQTAIVFPVSELSMPLPGKPEQINFQDINPEDNASYDNFGHAIRDVLKSQVGYNDMSLDVVAEITGLTPRTLQRGLKKSNLTYREIIEQVRFEATLPLLKDKQHNLLDIALELGYSDAAHFTRAFRRWTGVSPSQYRKQCEA